MQCERKPITKCIENGTNENHPRAASLSPDQHRSVYPVHQEKPEIQPLAPNRISVSSPTSSSQISLPGFPTEQFDCIISSEHLQFKLNPPTLGVSSLSMEYVYEIATRLLFLTVDWARSIQAFRSLENSDQLVLLQSTWSDLFMLGVAQCSSSFPMSPLLTLAAVHIERNEGSEDRKSPMLPKEPNMLERIMSVKDLLFSLEKLELDSAEYALLKAIVLFNSGMCLWTSFDHFLFKVLLGKTLNSHSASLNPDMATGKFNAACVTLQWTSIPSRGLSGPEEFSHLESHSKISNLMITEMFS